MNMGPISVLKMMATEPRTICSFEMLVKTLLKPPASLIMEFNPRRMPTNDISSKKNSKNLTSL